MIAALASPVVAQIKAQPRTGATPPWSKGIAAIGPESYYHAIECGKQGGDDPPCVFWDSGLCRNDDFAIAMYTPYKQVAYEVVAGGAQEAAGAAAELSGGTDVSG